MTNRITALQVMRNMWLAGMSFDDVYRSIVYTSAPAAMRSEIINSWSTLDHAFSVVCAAGGIDFEPARVVRTLKSPPQKKSAQGR